jgi:hypothetical protein
VIGEAIIEAATGVQGKMNLRKELIMLFNKIKMPEKGILPTIEHLEQIVTEAMAQAFTIV